MGGFNPPVPQHDNNWEIRVAVLLSLFFQVLILFIGPMRKRSSSPVVGFAIWSCYLLADWVADLALGLLLNNMGNIGGHAPGGSSSITHASGLKRVPAGAAASAGDSSGSPIIFAFWTPFLLLHLGGQDTMTAYSIQDNDLWLRHLIGLLFELFSACVIFFCSLQGNPMILATVLMFVVGIIKYGERTYSLYSGSVDGILADIIGDPDPGPNYAKLMGVFDGKEKAGLIVEISIPDDQAMEELEELKQAEITRSLKWSKKSLEAQAYDFFHIYRRLCFDVKLSYNERKISQACQAFFVERDDMTPTRAFQVVEVELNFIYDMVHTKQPVAHSKAGCVLRFVGSTCIVSALLIFFFHHKSGFTRVDVAITYALLLGGMALDVATLAMLLVSNWTLAFLEGTPWLAWLARAVKSLRPRQRRWSETTSQLNLISYCLRKPDPYADAGGCRHRFCSPHVVRALAKVAEKLHSTKAKSMTYEEMTNVCSYRGDGVLIHDEGFHGELVARLTKVTRDGGGQPAEGEKEEEDVLVKEKINFLVSTSTDLCFHLLLLKFVFDGLKEKANKVKAKNMTYEEMTKVCSYRGDGVLIHDEGFHGELVARLTKVTRDGGGQPAEGEKEEEDVLVKEKINFLVGSVQRREFDESLLLWHIATDLCFHPLPEYMPENEPTGSEKKPIGKTLSEYMLYLLIKQPKILLASAGIGLKRYRDTCAEAERFFESAAVWDPDHDDARKMLLSVNTSKKPSKVKGDRSKSVLFDAVILAKVLRELGEELMWEVVARVWGEMLTYAAGKCKGSTHVQQLSRGGELITMVWFLMVHMGLSVDDVDKTELDIELIPKLIVHDQ